MRPLALMTRNQGRSRELGVWRSTVPTNLARRGKPASSAMAPYVLTRPRGMRLTAAKINAAFVGGAACRVFCFAVFRRFDVAIAVDFFSDPVNRTGGLNLAGDRGPQTSLRRS